MWLGNESIFSFSEFKWLNKKETDKFDVNFIKQNSSNVYVLEVDLEYPDELHELHNDYPLVPKNLKLIIICCQIIVVALQMNIA